MAKLTREQFQLDCGLVLTAYGMNYCFSFWANNVWAGVESYHDACVYTAGMALTHDATITKDRMPKILELYDRDRTSQPHTV